MKILRNMKIFGIFLKYRYRIPGIGKMVGPGDGAEIFDKLEPEPEPHKKIERLCNTGYNISQYIKFSIRVLYR
jgi:hypothetical protein